MRVYTTQHPYYWGIDLHARTMSVCLLDQAGATLLHRHMPATPEALLKAIAPYRDQIVLAAACLCTWSWLADVCAEQRRPVVLGHALYMQASHGGKATHDTLDAHNIAVLRRGGMRPQASGSPAEMRATRDRRRRRMHLARKRGDLRAQVQNTTSPYNLPAIGTKSADQTNRDGVAERFAEPAGQKRLDVDLARIGSDDDLLRDVALTLVNTATHQAANTRYLRQTVPGLGKSLSLVLRYALHPLDRCPPGQDCASSCRLVTCAQAAAGKRSGTSGTKIGKAHLQWAFSAAAVLGLRDHPAGQKFLARWETKHRTGNALTILAQQLARAVYDMVTHKTAFDLHKFLNGSGRGVGELDASRDDPGLTLTLYARH